ncbi:MAG TPA: ComEC/Rec2 family competence protein [Candidatus Saccharimonadales bacterium]|nr:ComEC/Rec2 family competence protein [Candidatus Saccharimonadales bacterium]
MATQYRRTTLIIAFSVAIVLGVASAYKFDLFSVSYTWLAFLLTVLFLTKRNAITLICLVILGLVLGNQRGGVIKQQLVPVSDLFDHQVILTGVAENDGVYSTKNQVSFDVSNISISDPIEIDVPGKFKVEGFGVNAVYRGDEVQVEGKLRSTIGSRQGRIGFGTIEVIGQGSSPIETVRRKFRSGMQSALPEPQASFAMGLLIGEKSTLPKTTSNSLSAVGLTHIIAVSGYNLTIIVLAVRRLLRKRSKYQSTIIAMALIGLFVLLTGFSASIIRAAIVSLLSIVAWYYGRKIRPLLLITFTAAITALWNPLYIWSDAGWYLSFLAFYGVLVLAPLIHRRFFADKPRGVVGLLIIESLCAQIMTAPYIIYTFKQLSIVALPANVLVVPLVPLAMFLSLIAGLAGALFASLASWLAWPAKILLTYMLDLAALLARIPHALWQQTLSIGGLFILYGAILLISSVLGHKTTRRATITDIKV